MRPRAIGGLRIPGMTTSSIEGSKLVRYPEEKIKEAILHPDLEIRRRATRYFSDSYSPDPSIMPQVIKAVGMYGRDGAYQLIGASRDLEQTEDSIDWVIDELNDERSNDYENYVYNLSMVLLHANPDAARAQGVGGPGGPPFPGFSAPRLHRATEDALVGRGDVLAGAGRVQRGGERQAIYQ